MSTRGNLARNTYPSELIEKSTGRRVFIRGVNVPAKLAPFNYGLRDSDLQLLVSSGFTSIRLTVAWAALEPEEGRYDTKHMEYIRETVRRCGDRGISVIVDPHQDVWSECSGGDGAPEWTLSRLGFRLENMAACCGCYRAKPGEYPMLWATNYHLFACATMFTLFFGSKQFAPHVNIDGKHAAQDWLQGHFIEAFCRLAEVLKDEKNVLGFGTLNEPSLGWVGHEDIRNTGDNWSFGYSLAPQQCMQLAAGNCIKDVKFYQRPLSLPEYRTLNEHNAVLCDSIWPPNMQPNHFALASDAEKTFLVPFWDKFTKAIHTAGGGDLLIFTETPPLEHGGQIVKKYKRPDYEVSAPHYYDPVTMGLGKYLWFLALDFLTGLPGLCCFAPWARYNTVNLITHKQGGIVFGEMGVPWIDEKNTNAALEAMFNATEANLVPAIFLWCYVPNHGANDGWNSENFSIYSNGIMRVHTAIRPYAMLVAGRPLRMTCENRLFRLEFESCSEVDSTETVIYLTDKPRLSIKLSDGAVKLQANNILSYSHTPSLGKATHWIFVEFAN